MDCEKHKNYARDTRPCVICVNEENSHLRAALEKIAKPALGGKQQQWIAQEALASGEK